MVLVQSVGKIVEINAFSPNFDKQDMHCTYYVTLRLIHLTILAVDNQYVLQIQCVLLASLTQHMKRMNATILTHVKCLDLP